MLVCNVSLRPPRLAIAADLIEAVTAADATATGQVVFATLVDDPANVIDTIDAYSGEIMLEMATATDTPNAGVLAVYAVDVAETVTAADTQNGVLAVPYATFDGTATGVTLSNGNLTATHTNTSTAQGARSTSNQTSGKYYFEVTVGATHGGADGIGLLMSTASYNDMISQVNTTVCYIIFAFGAIYTNGTNPASAGANCVPGDIVRVAIDLTARKAWFTINNFSYWNNRPGLDDPVTGVSVVNIGSGSFAPALCFGTSASAVGDNMTANFGSTPFTYTPPSGFGNWPA